jgi:hypothetical protein
MKPAVLIATFLLLFLPPGLEAQREYAIGVGLNLVSGGDNNPRGGTSGPGTETPLRLFYGAYPSISLTSTGARSSVGLSYGFGFDRTETDPRTESESHSVSISISRQLGPRWSLSLSEGFRQTADLRTFNVFQGIVLAPEGLIFVFDPVGTDLEVRSNSASIGLDYSTSTRSRLSFTGSHDLRKYGGDSRFFGILSDQQSVSSGLLYRRELSSRSSWSARYRVAYSEFRDFENVVSQAASLGFRTEIAQALFFELTGGPSYVSSLGGASGYLRYNAGASLGRQGRSFGFSLYYSASSGESSGLGSVSDTQRAGVSAGHSGGPVTVSVDVSAFDTRGRLDNVQRTRGVSGSATLGYPMTDTLTLQVGTRYQRYTNTSTFAFTQERVFLSLRYDRPELWTWFR